MYPPHEADFKGGSESTCNEFENVGQMGNERTNDLNSGSEFTHIHK